MVLDVSDWEIVGENTGSHRGLWLVDPGSRRRALLKFPQTRVARGSRFVTGESWAEVLASALGRQLGVFVPDVQLASYDASLCALSWSFVPPGYELREGVSLINQLPEQDVISLQEMRDVLGGKLGAQVADQAVCQMICFDILIANKDRHLGNWGLLVPNAPEAVARPAAVYDNAGAFGSLMDPEKVRQRLCQEWGPFDHGFKYEIGLERGRQSTIPQLLTVLRKLDAGLYGFGRSLGLITATLLDQVLAAIPAKAMSADRREFAARLILHRKSVLESGVNSCATGVAP